MKRWEAQTASMAARTSSRMSIVLAGEIEHRGRVAKWLLPRLSWYTAAREVECAGGS